VPSIIVSGAEPPEGTFQSSQAYIQDTVRFWLNERLSPLILPHEIFDFAGAPLSPSQTVPVFMCDCSPV